MHGLQRRLYVGYRGVPPHILYTICLFTRCRHVCMYIRSWANCTGVIMRFHYHGQIQDKNEGGVFMCLCTICAYMVEH